MFGIDALIRYTCPQLRQIIFPSLTFVFVSAVIQGLPLRAQSEAAAVVVRHAQVTSFPVSLVAGLHSPATFSSITRDKPRWQFVQVRASPPAAEH